MTIQHAYWAVDENIGPAPLSIRHSYWSIDENILPQANPWTDPMDNFSNWSEIGNWVINPAGAAYQLGDAFSSATLMKIEASPYVEIDAYLDANTSNWLMLKLNVTTGANGYNNEGVGVLIRGSGVIQPFLTSAPSPSSFTLDTRPGSDATSVRIGIHRKSLILIDIYMNGVRKWKDLVPQQSMSGTKIMLSAFENVGAHVKSVSFADGPPLSGSGTTVFNHIIRKF